MKKLTIVMAVLDILALICFVIVYFVPGFKNTIIMTALSTKTHQYIAYTFYSDETVSKVMAADSYIPLTDDVDLDAIVIDNKERDSYENKYDEQILTRTPGNDNYKLIKLKIAGYEAFLTAIYDPSKVGLIHSKTFNTGNGQETVINMCNRYKGKVCINGGMFKDPDGWGSDIPQGYLIKNGKIIWSDKSGKANLIGFTTDNKLLLTRASGKEALEMGMKDALEFGPFLIVNGKPLKFNSNSSAGGYSRAARVAIGQRRDGVILFLVTNGTHGFGVSLGEMVTTLQNYGAYNAANLDGGTSSQLVIGGKLINTPKSILGHTVVGGRTVVSGFGLLP